MSNRTEVLSSYEENRIGFPVSDFEKLEFGFYLEFVIWNLLFSHGLRD
jgi:hypothetical protein